MEVNPESDIAGDKIADKSLILEHFLDLVLYIPLLDEVPFRQILEVPVEANCFVIEPKARLDPSAEAKRAQTILRTDRTCVLLPGTRFDSIGTRIGRGGGWYDRFLSHVPESWFRIGFCFSDQFSEETIERKPWDQPVDLVGIMNRELGALTWKHTHARPKVSDILIV